MPTSYPPCRRSLPALIAWEMLRKLTEIHLYSALFLQGFELWQLHHPKASLVQLLRSLNTILCCGHAALEEQEKIWRGVPQSTLCPPLTLGYQSWSQGLIAYLKHLKEKSGTRKGLQYSGHGHSCPAHLTYFSYSSPPLNISLGLPEIVPFMFIY